MHSRTPIICNLFYTLSCFLCNFLLETRKLSITIILKYPRLTLLLSKKLCLIHFLKKDQNHFPSTRIRQTFFALFFFPKKLVSYLSEAILVFFLFSLIVFLTVHCRQNCFSQSQNKTGKERSKTWNACK